MVLRDEEHGRADPNHMMQVPFSKTDNVRENRLDNLGRKTDHHLPCRCVHCERNAKLPVTGCGELANYGY